MGRSAVCVAVLVLLSAACHRGAHAVDSPEDVATKALFRAVAADDAAGIKSALASGARIDERRKRFTDGGQSPLMAASLRGSVHAVRVLLKAGADATIGESDGYTPLHGAAFQGRAEVAQVLLANPLVPHEVHKDGFWPIHRACWGREQRHADTVAAFLEAGSPGDVKSTSGETPLVLATRSGNRATMVILSRWEAARKHGADDNADL